MGIATGAELALEPGRAEKVRAIVLILAAQQGVFDDKVEVRIADLDQVAGIVPRVHADAGPVVGRPLFIAGRGRRGPLGGRLAGTV